jgi:peptidoglycan hydrolase-like protein with peptidoglycan-binding domain
VVVTPRSSRRLRLLGFASLCIAAGVLVTWAVGAVFAPAASVVDPRPYTYAEATNGQVGTSINLNTAVEWAPVLLASNLASGIVTTVDVAEGQVVGQGARLYSVNLRPTVIAQGSIPAFRALSQGAVGADVAQLQSMLAAIDIYRGKATGTFDSATSRAVRLWQRESGVPADGIVQAGDLVFVPALPTRVTLDTNKVKRGGSLSGGEPVVNGLSSSPAFTIPVTSAQATLMPSGTAVDIAGPKGEKWKAVVRDQKPTDQNGIIVNLAATADGSICGDTCAEIPVGTQTLLSAQIHTVPTVEGIIIPAAAILSSASGKLSVVDRTGKSHPIKIVASASGMSVVRGIKAGLSIRVPAAGQ